eukprot:TRINITY_DN2766_c0_g1_i3.p1 TRINITY_DN2766_c0_g1~~TRINITY_DN2766_c0_g1_i3.p1  ORF type:complete len:465 (+),score=111.26 TRINITY_DN2766_c0_g1_i3:3-1397(+)
MIYFTTSFSFFYLLYISTFLLVSVVFYFFFFLMIRRPPRSTLSSSSAASDVYKRQGINAEYMGINICGGNIKLAHNKLYRNFIILQEDERGHSESSDKALSGYAKVEAKGDKCKISFYAQNLKKDSNYFMVLICCKRDFKELIDLGPLTINEAGKGDTSKEYYINNIADLKVSYEKISGAAICKTIGKETDFIMHGFMNGEEPAENWRKFKMVKVQSKRESQAIELKKSLTKDKEFVIKKEVSKTEVSNIKDINLSNKKENILPQASEKLDSNVSDIEEKIVEDILSADERSKYKNDKKDCDKKADKVKCQEEEKKYEKKDKDIDFEQAMNKLYNELEYCSKLIDLDVHDMNSEYTVYGFIKKKRDNKYEWTKFKMEKCPKSTDLKGYVNKRIEENTKLDLDIPDFDKYEQEVDRIKEINDKNSDNGINEYFEGIAKDFELYNCLLYTSPSPRDRQKSRMPSSA